MARVPRLSHMRVKAAGEVVQFVWTWSGGRPVEVRVLRSEEWFCESADAYVDGSWAQRPAYAGDAGGFADRGIATDRDMFYSVFARYPGKSWRAPVLVRVFAVGHEPPALGLPPSGVEWQSPQVADGHRRVEIDGHHESDRVVAALMPDGLRDERLRALVEGQSGTSAARGAERPALVSPEYSASLQRWRRAWVVVGALALLALLVSGALVTPLAIVALGFTAFALLRPVLGPDTEPPAWLSSALVGLTVVTVMVAFVLLMVSASVPSTALPVAIVVFMAFVVVAEWALPYGGLAFGHYVYGPSGLPDRVWLVAILLIVDAACVVLGLAGAALTVVTAIGFMIAGLTVQRSRGADRRAVLAARASAAAEEGRRRRAEELMPTVVDPQELARRQAERAAAAGERGDDEAWEPPAYRV